MDEQPGAQIETDYIPSAKRIKINWTAIAAIAAAVAAIFAGLAWWNTEQALNYTRLKEAPDLWIVSDKFVYGDYGIAELSDWGIPRNVPKETVVLRHYPVIDLRTGDKLNRICAIFNSSEKHSTNAQIDNYSGLFGEIHFENRGDIGIKKIEIINCSFKMREVPGLDLEDFSLEPSGALDVDIGRGSPFIMFIGYLYDNDNHMMCNPKYVTNGRLNPTEIEKKRMFDDQLRCYLPVIIDLYEELSFTFRFTAQDGSEYTQTHTIQIQLDGDGGIYNPKSNTAVPMK